MRFTLTVLSDRIKQTKFESAGQEAILSILICADHFREDLNDICLKENISLKQFNILRILKGVFPDGYARCDISNRMVERAPDTTRIIDRLVKCGLVSRDKSPDDLRQSIAKITEEGINLLKKLSIKVKEYNTNFESKISTEKCEDISSICDQIMMKE